MVPQTQVFWRLLQMEPPNLTETGNVVVELQNDINDFIASLNPDQIGDIRYVFTPFSHHMLVHVSIYYLG